MIFTDKLQREVYAAFFLILFALVINEQCVSGGTTLFLQAPSPKIFFFK